MRHGNLLILGMKSFYLFFLPLALVGFDIANAQTDCTLRKDAQGIKVYSCNVEGSKFKGIKANFELDANLHQVVSALYDVPSYTKWQYHMISAKLVNQGVDELMYHSEVSAPWPVSNRDMVVRLHFNYDSIAKVLLVNAIGLPSTLPTVPDVIRIPYFKARWTIQESTLNKLLVQYELDIDVGGSIPAWLMNMAQAEGPFETFSKLKEQLKRQQYKRKEYPFLND